MKKLCIIVASTILFLALFFILLTPSFLSSQAGRNFLASQISKSSHAKVSIQGAKFSWFDKQKITGFHLEKKSEMLVNFESLTLETSLWNLLRRSGSIQQALLVKPQIAVHAKTIIAMPPSTKAAPDKKPKKKQKSFWSNFSGNLKVEDGQITLEQGALHDIRLENVDLNLSLAKKRNTYTLQASGNTLYDQFRGSFNVDGNVSETSEIIHLETSNILEIDGTAHFDQFPVGGIEAVCVLVAPEYKGYFIEALGERLNLNLNFAKSDLALDLKSPRMTLSFQSDYDKGVIHLKNPLQMTWSVRPLVLQPFLKTLPIISRGDTYVQLELNTLSLLLKNKGFDFPSLACTGNVSLSRGAFSLEKDSQSLLLDHLNLSFSTAKLQERINLAVQSTFRYGGFPETKVQGKAIVENLSSSSQFDLNVRNFPTALAEELLKRDSTFEPYIGSNFDFIAERYSKGTKDELLVSISTPYFNLSSSRFLVGENYRLLTPTSFTYTINPKLLDQLANPVTIDGIILSLDLDSNSWQNSQLKMTAKGHDFILNDLGGLGKVQLPSFSGRFDGSFRKLKSEITTQLEFATNSWGQTIMGSPVILNGSGELDLSHAFSVSPLELKLESKKLKTTIEGTIEKKAFVLQKPLVVEFLLEPAQINPILAKQGNLPTLAQSTSIKLQISPGTFPLTKKDLSIPDVKMTGSIPELQIVAPETNYRVILENVTAKYERAKHKVSKFSLAANAKDNNEQGGSIEVSLAGRDLNQPAQVEVRFKALSSIIADALFQMHGTLPPMIGRSIDLEFLVQRKQQTQDLDITVNSPKLNLEGAFTASDTLKLRGSRRPLKIHWNMDEIGYQAFQRLRGNNPVDSPFVIQNEAAIRLDIAPLSLRISDRSGLFPTVDFNLYQAEFDADVRISSLILKQVQLDAISELQRLNLNVRKKPKAGPLTFNIEGVVVSKDSVGKSGQIKGRGTLENFLSKAGQIDPNSMNATLDMTLSHLPSVLIDIVAKTHDASALPPSAILGESVNASLDIDIRDDSGAVKIDLNAAACRGNLDGIVGNGILYLKQPIRAAMTITPEMNLRLAKTAKIMITSMKNPVTLLIHPDGFAMPLRHLGLSGANIGYGRIDFGQLTCRNAGSASDVSSIFRMEDKQNNISIWFAPMEFNIRQGLMLVDRTEILYNRAYQVALWGNIDFNRRYVDMILGLTAQSLRAAIGITDVPSSYVLKVPITGPFGNVKVDKGAATAKIALLLGQRLAPQTGVFGNVLGALGRLADDQSDVPPPKPPFPWQNVINMQDRFTPEASLKKLSKKKAKGIYKDLKKMLKSREKN